jgi:hypothetical protein
MRCRTLDTPAPKGGRNDSGHPELTPCDASPDLGLHYCGLRYRRRARPTRSRRPPLHAGDATYSLSTHWSLQDLPRLACGEAGKPPGDTRTLVRRSGPPPNLHHGGKHDSGGQLQRQRNATRGTTTHRRNGTLTHALGRNRTLTRATQRRRNHGRGGTQPDTQLDWGTRIREDAGVLSNARNNHSGETRNAGCGIDHAVVNCGKPRKRLTGKPKLTRTLEGHLTPLDVLFAFPLLDRRRKATRRHKLGDYKKMLLDCGFCG